jgi:hypothetical protein
MIGIDDWQELFRMAQRNRPHSGARTGGDHARFDSHVDLHSQNLGLGRQGDAQNSIRLRSRLRSG